MKHLTHIILLSVVLSLFGCSDRRATSVLNHADSLLSTHPDTVLVMLDSLRAERSSDMSRRQKMRLELLRADAQNKSYVNFTTDSVMREVTAYYDAHGTAQERMRAHYLLGCTYRDMGDAPRALECYHDAIDKADTTSSDCDYKLLSRVYGQMAGLYRRQNMLTQSIEHLDKMQVYSLLSGDTISFIITQDQIGSIYGLMNNYDSLLTIKNRVVQLYKSRGLYTHAAISLGTTIYAYLANKDYLQAKRMMDIYETKSGHFHTNGDIAKGKEIYYYTKGIYYLDIQKYDSAEFFFRKLLNNANTFNDRISASQGLCKLYTELNNNDSVAKFAQNSYIFNDSAYSNSTLYNMQLLESIHDYSINKHLANKQFEKAQSEKQKNIVLSFFVASLLIVIAYIYNTYVKYKDKKQSEITDIHKLYRNDIAMLEKSKQSLMHKLHKNENNHKLDIEKYETLINELNRRISQYKTNTLPIEDKCIFDSSIYDKFVSYDLKRKKRPSKEDWLTLYDTVELFIPQFKYILKDKFRLSDEEYKVCILDRLFFDVNSIVWLTDKSNSYISKIRKRLLKKVFGKDGEPKNFDIEIRNIG